MEIGCKVRSNSRSILTTRNAIIGLLLGALLMFPALWLAMILATLGQGTLYTAPKMLFPFAMFDASFPKDSGRGFELAAYSQLPVYGLILGAFFNSAWFHRVVFILALAHIIAALLIPFVLPYR